MSVISKSIYWNIFKAESRANMGFCMRSVRVCRLIAATRVIFILRVLQINLRFTETKLCSTLNANMDVTIFMLRAANKFQSSELHNR